MFLTSNSMDNGIHARSEGAASLAHVHQAHGVEWKLSELGPGGESSTSQTSSGIRPIQAIESRTMDVGSLER